MPRSIHEGVRDLARDIAKTDAYRSSRRQRKKVEMLFAHLKRILRLDRLRLRDRAAPATSSSWPRLLAQSAVLRLCRHAIVGEVVGCGDGQIALARRLRFWTVAANRNSSFARCARGGAGGSSRGCVSCRQSRFRSSSAGGRRRGSPRFA